MRHPVNQAARRVLADIPRQTRVGQRQNGGGR
jgi:hypothetical protein